MFCLSVTIHTFNRDYEPANNKKESFNGPITFFAKRFFLFAENPNHELI